MYPVLRSTSLYPEVAQGTLTYTKVTRSTSKHPEVARTRIFTNMYSKVLRSTQRYLKVPQNTNKIKKQNGSQILDLGLLGWLGKKQAKCHIILEFKRFAKGLVFSIHLYEDNAKTGIAWNVLLHRPSGRQPVRRGFRQRPSLAGLREVILGQVVVEVDFKISLRRRIVELALMGVRPCDISRCFS